MPRGRRLHRCAVVRQRVQSFFERDLSTFEEAPERGDASRNDLLRQLASQFQERNVRLLRHGVENHLSMRLNVLRLAIRALLSGSKVSGFSLAFAPANGAGRAYPETLRRRPA